jgi:hypothetical protein
VNASETCDQSGSVELLELIESAAINDTANDFSDIKLLLGVLGNDTVELRSWVERLLGSRKDILNV